MTTVHGKRTLEKATYYESFGGGLGIPFEIEFRSRRKKQEKSVRRFRRLISRYVGIARRSGPPALKPGSLPCVEKSSFWRMSMPAGARFYAPFRFLRLILERMRTRFRLMLDPKPSSCSFVRDNSAANRGRADVWFHP
jgi:hypothetical protein